MLRVQWGHPGCVRSRTAPGLQGPPHLLSPQCGPGGLSLDPPLLPGPFLLTAPKEEDCKGRREREKAGRGERERERRVCGGEDQGQEAADIWDTRLCGLWTVSTHLWASVSP